MRVNIFTVISEIFYIIPVAILIVNTVHNCVYGYGYSDKGMDFTVPTPYCSFNVGPQAKNKATGYIEGASDKYNTDFSKHSFYLVHPQYIQDKYLLPAVDNNWNFGQFKVEFYYDSAALVDTGRLEYWIQVSSTDKSMAKKKVNCDVADVSDTADTEYYGLFNLFNTEKNTTTRNMYFKDRSLYSDSRVMNLAPLTIGEPGQGGGLRSGDNGYTGGGAECHIPKLTVEVGITVAGNFSEKAVVNPATDYNFTQIQNELRGGAKKNRYFPKGSRRTSMNKSYPSNAEDIGGRFKVYAGLLFFHRIESNIENNGTIQGFYGISASCPIPYKGDVSNVKDGTGFYGKITNTITGVIQGEKAAIDIDAGASAYTSIGDVETDNQNIIKGSIIIPDIQKGSIRNAGKIIPYLKWPMHMYLGGVSLNSLEDSIIHTDYLTMAANSVITNQGAIIVNNTLTCSKIANKISGILTIKKYSNLIKKIDNYGVINFLDDSSITSDSYFVNNLGARITAHKNLTITIDVRKKNNFINYGSLSVDTLYSFNFKNNGDLFPKKISGSDLVNNREIISDLLTIDASVTNNKNITVSTLQINHSFLNAGAMVVDSLGLDAATILENKAEVTVKDKVTILNKAQLLNKVNAKFRFIGQNFFFNPSETPIINQGNFIVEHNLKLQANLTTAATYSINTFFSSNSAKLIKTADSYCRIENFADGTIENLGGVIIHNVVGKAYIDKYNPVIVTEVSSTGDFNIDYLSPGKFKNSISNQGTITVNKRADLYDNTLFNEGNFISYGHTNFSGKIPFINRGNFTFGDAVTTEHANFFFIASLAGKKTIFSKRLDASINFKNSAILQLDKPIGLISYQGNFQDDIIINSSINIPSSTAYLSANKIELFNGGAKPISRIIINPYTIELNKKHTMTLLQAKTIANIYGNFGGVKYLLYGDINYISKLPGYDDYSMQKKGKLLFLASNPRIIKDASKTESLLVDCSWNYIPKEFYKKDAEGIYSMDYINDFLSGDIKPGVNFNIFCDGDKQWYVNKNILYIGRASQNLPRTTIELVTSGIADAFSVTSLMKTASVGTIEVVASIKADNNLQANALAIRNKDPIPNSYSNKKLPDYLIYVLSKIKIDDNSLLQGGRNNKSGLEIASVMAGLIENHGVITGYNGINIVGPLNYVNGNITNYGDIIANIVINTNMNIPYDSDKTKKCIITNYKKMEGGFILGGYNCSLINYGSITSKNKGIIGHYSDNNTIHNKSDMVLSCIKIEEASSTLNLINEGSLSIAKSSVVSQLINKKNVISKDNLAVTNFLSNSGMLIINQLKTSEKIQLKYDSIVLNANIDNSGTITIATPFTCSAKLTNQQSGVIKIKENLYLLSNDFANSGEIHTNKDIYVEANSINNNGLLSANTLFIQNNIYLSQTGRIYTTEIKPSANSASIKGEGYLVINNKSILFNKNIDITASKLTLNVDKIEVLSQVNINTKNLLINNNSNTCNININPRKQLTLKSTQPISKNINLTNSGTLELDCSLHSQGIPLNKIDYYTANRMSSLILKLPDLLAANKEIADLTMPIVQITKTAKLDMTTKITIEPTGNTLRDATAEIIIMKASVLVDENNNPLNNIEGIINKRFETENTELTLNNIKVANNTITAIATIIDKKRLGPNMRKAQQLLSLNMSSGYSMNTNKDIIGVVYIYNHKVEPNKPINKKELTSAYTDNLILSPVNIIDYGLNFNAQNLIINPGSSTKVINSFVNMPALVIGTTVLQDKFFHGSSHNYIEFESIELSNIIINGKKNFQGDVATADGLIINGSNDLRLAKGILFGTYTQVLAGVNNHAVNFSSYYTGDIVNNGVIGDGLNYSGVHLKQPIEGTLVNNNTIVAKVKAIDITPIKSWAQGKSFKIINNGNITGSIEAKADSSIYIESLKIINNGSITANAIKSYANNIKMNITNKGFLEITGAIEISKDKLINNGELTVNKLSLVSDFESKGNITAKYLKGNGHKLNVSYIKVNNIEDVELSSTLVDVYSSIAKKVTVYATLVINGNVENNGELTTNILQFATNSNITNNGNIKINAPIVNLDNSIFYNKGSLAIPNTLKLTGDFNTAIGKLFASTIELNGKKIVANEGAVICCNKLINTGSNSNVVIQQGTLFKFGNDIGSNDNVSVSGDISFSKVDLSEYTENKYEASLKLNSDVVCEYGIMQAGNIITDNQKSIKLTINPKAQALFNLPIQEEKLHIDNKGVIQLVKNSSIFSYTGENATIEMALSGKDSSKKANSFLAVSNDVKFNNNSIIKLKPSIYATPEPYKYVELITASSIKYKSSTGVSNELTTANAWSLIKKEENNKRIIRLKDVKVTHKENRSIISAIVGIRNIANFPSYMVYVDQQLHPELLANNCCKTDEAIEGIAWIINRKQKNIAQSNNLIISPYNLVDTYRVASFNYKDKVLSLSSVKDTPMKINATAKTPAIIIGTEITSTDKTQKIVPNNNSILAINSIYIDDLIIDGVGEVNDTTVKQDGLLITGRNKLQVANVLEIGTNCILQTTEEKHALHIAAEFKGNIVNFGSIGNDSDSVLSNNAILISQPYSGTITNYNKIIAKNFALIVNSKSSWSNDKKLNIVNKGEIIGGIFVNKNPNVEQEITVTLVNYGRVKNPNYRDNVGMYYMIKRATGTVVNIHNKTTGSISIHNIDVDNIINNGVLGVFKIAFSNINNSGIFFLSGTDTLKINNKNFTNTGLMKLTNKIELTGDFTNNGTIDTFASINSGLHKLTNNKVIISKKNITSGYFINATNSIINVATLTIVPAKNISENYGDIVTNNFIQQGTLTNNNNLQIKEAIKLTSKLVNNGTLDVASSLELTDNYHNNGYIKTNILDGKNLAIINTNSLAKVLSSKFKDITIKGSAVVVKELTGMVNITDLYSSTDINQYSNLISTNWVSDNGKIVNYGSVTITNKAEMYKLANHGVLTVKMLKNGQVDVDVDLIIDNYNQIHAESIKKCRLNNYSKGCAIFTTIENSNIVNQGVLKVTKSLVNNITIKGNLDIDGKVVQHGSCHAEVIKGDTLEVNGTIHASVIDVSNLYNEAILTIRDKLIVDVENKLHNSGYITTDFIDIKGVLYNKPVASLKVLKQENIYLSDKNCNNQGSIEIENNIVADGFFNITGSVSAKTINISPNAEVVITNKGNIYLDHIKNTLLNNSIFANKGKLIVANDIILHGAFNNKGIINAKNICSINYSAKLINESSSQLSCENIKNIQVVNEGFFKVEGSILGDVVVEGTLALGSDIRQYGNLLAENIQPAKLGSNVNLNIQDNSFFSLYQPLINQSFSIANDGCLQILSGSKIKSYTSNGGILKIYLPKVLSKINTPLLSVVDTIALNDNLNEKPLIVLLANNFNKINKNHPKTITILEASKILLNKNNISQKSLNDILAIQDSSAINDAVITSSVLLHIGSLRIESSNNKVAINANVYWKDIENIKGLLSRPISLSMLAKVLQQEKNILHKKHIFAKINDDINHKKIPKESYYIATELNRSMPLDKILLLAVPDNSSHDQNVITSTCNESITSLDKRLQIDRTPRLFNNKSGINSGSIYNDLYIWSAVSFQKENGYKQSLYSYGDSISKFVNVGIDYQFNKQLKIGLMLANITSRAKTTGLRFNSEYDVVRNYDINAMLSSVYLSQKFNLCTVNIYLNTAKYKFKQKINSEVANYSASLLGIHSEVVYPFSYGNVIFELAEFLRINSIFVSTHQLGNIIKHGYRCNLVNVGFSSSCCYYIPVVSYCKLYLGCSLSYMCSFAMKQKQKIDISYFNNDFKLTQQEINKHDIKIESLVNLTLFNRLKLVCNLGLGFKSHSSYLSGSFKLNYNF